VEFIDLVMAIVNNDNEMCSAAHHDEPPILKFHFFPWRQLDESHKFWWYHLVRFYVKFGTGRRTEMMHGYWLKHMERDSWTWGREFSLAAKRHPWVAPFCQLRALDQTRLRMVRSLATTGRELLHMLQLP
jgi:hypothetical protein